MDKKREKIKLFDEYEGLNAAELERELIFQKFLNKTFK